MKIEEWEQHKQDSDIETLGAYVSLQDANWKAIELQREQHDEEWRETYSSHNGCANFSTEDSRSRNIRLSSCEIRARSVPVG